MTELLLLSKIIGGIIHEAIARLKAEILQEIKAMDEKIQAIPAGINGKDGEKGDKGETGMVGPRGEIGESGRDGRDGVNGRDGDKGDKGEKGESGEVGKRGEKGESGRDGRDGMNGQDGKDAFQIDILPMIVSDAMYARGTFAVHRGGTVRAIRNTRGFDHPEDWQTVARGLAVLNIEQSDLNPRQFSFVLEMTDGKTFSQTFRMPAQIYRGIFTDGVSYTRGDTVTYGGSLWHCHAEESTARPGISTDWQLAVKEGRAGRDAEKSSEPKGNGTVRLK